MHCRRRFQLWRSNNLNKFILNSALIIFVRNPVPGKVKTRLASTLGNEKALAIYKILLSHTHTVSKALPVDKFIFYDDFINPYDFWENEIYEKKIQQGRDLGERMANAFTHLFRKNYRKIVIIGSDCFELTNEIITEAFRSLSQNDVVIGPAKDGGYYLLGMNRFIPELFREKKWSSDSVYKDTVNQIKELDKNLYELKLLNDIDKESDVDFNKLTDAI